MNEFVTLCSRDKLPIIWIQDTSGIDVGDDAERAELLGLGQSLIYSIQNSEIPQMEITLRKGTAADSLCTRWSTRKFNKCILNRNSRLQKSM